MMPNLFGYSKESAEDLVLEDSVYKAAFERFDKQLAGRIACACHRMGIFSMGKLLTMEPEWFGSLVKVRNVGKKVSDGITELAEGVHFYVAVMEQELTE